MCISTNSALALMTAGKATTLAEAFYLADRLIFEGEAPGVLGRWQAFSQRMQ